MSKYITYKVKVEYPQDEHSNGVQIVFVQMAENEANVIEAELLAREWVSVHLGVDPGWTKTIEEIKGEDL